MMNNSISIKLLEIAKAKKALLFGSFELSAGGTSPFYFDGRILTLDPEGSYYIAKGMIGLAQRVNANTIAGPTIGADPIVSAVVISSFLEKRPISGLLVREDQKLPNYLTEEEFNGIMQLDIIDVHFRKAFLFYYMTGCRKAEPFKADLNGNWLTIKSTDAKSHRTREVQLDPILKSIVTEMQDRFHMLMDEYGQKPRHIINRYGKEFKKACRQLGIKGKVLHNLRDTYAVRRWAITGDIKMVADEIGHASVVMTEKYAKCNLRRLQDDFPSLADRIALRLTPPMEDSYFTNLLQSI